MAGHLVNHNDDDDGDDVQWTLHRSPPNKDAQTANKHNGENHLLGPVFSSNPGDEDENVFNFALSFFDHKILLWTMGHDDWQNTGMQGYLFAPQVF